MWAKFEFGCSSSSFGGVLGNLPDLVRPTELKMRHQERLPTRRTEVPSYLSIAGIPCSWQLWCILEARA